MSIYKYTLALSLFIFSCQNAPNDTFQIKGGDLLFQDIDCGPFCEAIEKVTFGIDGAKLSHIGIATIENGHTFILEAGGKGVVKTPLDTFLQRSNDKNGSPKILVGRLGTSYTYLIPQAILNAKSRLGKSYDDIFDINNDSYYCSELIYHSFKEANQGKAIFKLFPMTFIDPDTGKTFGIWEDYYKELGVAIPEGELGLNPGGISRSPYINIVHAYGTPTGYNP